MQEGPTTSLSSLPPSYLSSESFPLRVVDTSQQPRFHCRTVGFHHNRDGCWTMGNAGAIVSPQPWGRSRPTNLHKNMAWQESLSQIMKSHSCHPGTCSSLETKTHPVWQVNNSVSPSQKKKKKDVHLLIPGTCEDVIWCGKKDFTNVIKELKMGKLVCIIQVKVKVAQSCLTLCDPMDHTVPGILQARILE